MKEEEREERDTGFCELLIKPTRNCWRDVYGFIVPFSRALKRPMQWTFCAVEWRAGGHGGRFVEFLDETQEWIMARCKQSSTRPPNCNFLCLILVTERKKYIYSTNIFFLHSSPFYFFEKVLKRIPSPLIPSYLSLFLERSVVSKDRRRSNCRRWKKISIFSLVQLFLCN